MVIHSVPSPIRRRPLDPSRYPLCHPQCSTSVLFGVLVYRGCSRARYMCIMRSLLACQIGCMQNSCRGCTGISRHTVSPNCAPSTPECAQASRAIRTRTSPWQLRQIVACVPQVFLLSSVNDTVWVGQDAVDREQRELVSRVHRDVEEEGGLSIE